MDDELENFLRERRARVAADKATLEEEPPYMEIKTKPLRAYESTVKENIPPKAAAQGTEDSCIVGLPLGVDYERKKQRLQHELRLDYRRYMAQKKHFGGGEPGPLLHLDNRRHIKAQLAASHGQQDSEEELELMDGRRVRHTGVNTSSDKIPSNRTDSRERKQTPVGVAREGWRSRAMNKHEDAEFATGLIIGAADTEETLKRRKQRYRLELQEQIAEQHRNKKREKDLELKVAATGANDPEKRPDRIRQFGLSNRRKDLKDLPLLGPLITADSESSSRGLLHVNNTERSHNDNNNNIRCPPDRPSLAFQNPPVEHSGGRGLSPTTNQPFHRATDTPRVPVFLPHPPDPYRSPYGEQHHHYYGTRSQLDPNMAYYGHLPVPPVSYWDIPAGGAVTGQFGAPSPPGGAVTGQFGAPILAGGGAVTGQFGAHSPPGGAVTGHFGSHSPYSDRSGPEPVILPHNDDSQVRGFSSDRSRLLKERSYREALKLQIQDQQEKRRLDREESERYEARLDRELKRHQPFGRGGGGAPLRDSTGNLIADLNQMHKLNEEAYINPGSWQRRAAAAMATPPRGVEPNEPNERSSHESRDRIAGFTHVQPSQFARGNVFATETSQQHLQEQDKYKAYLKQQMEEKAREKAEERERSRLEEEKEERRLAEQRDRIQREYEEEQDRKKRKEMEQKAKNEELIRLAERRKQEAEKKKRDAEEEQSAERRSRYERERQARLDEVHREPSPPIPTLQKKHGTHRHTPRPPTVDSLHSTAAPMSERSLSGLQSPPVPACRNQLRAAGDRQGVFSELSALRRQLRSEQKRLEGRLNGDWDRLGSALSHRPGERPQVDVFDMARLRLQAPVRRPSSRSTEPKNLLRIHDSLQLNYTDADSRLDFSEEGGGVSRGRRRDFADLYQPISSQRSTAQDDYLDLSPPRQHDYLRSAMGSARGSLLESESAFIDPLGDAFTVPSTPELHQTPVLSARERRRLKQTQRPQEPLSGHDDWPSSRPDCTSPRPHTAGAADSCDDSSSSSSSSSSSPLSRGRQSSAETDQSERWMRPGTSHTVKCLTQPSRRDRFGM